MSTSLAREVSPNQSAGTDVPAKSIPPVRRWIIVAALVLISFSIGVRLFNLDTKPFWFDEEIVAVLISSKTQPSFDNYRGSAMPAAQWRQLELVSPTAPLFEVLNNLKVKLPPDQAPLYCLAAREFIQMFGDTVGVIRLLSVIFSFIAFPIVFLLARQMFKNAEVAWLSVALLACSPFQLLFAQEARQYTMWFALAALTWITMARACKNRSTKSWILFGVSGAVCILTHYASFLMMALNGATLLVSRQRAFKGLAIAAVACILIVSPWFLYAGLGCLSTYNEHWMLSHPSAEQYWLGCAVSGARVLFDFPWPSTWLLKGIVYLIFLLEMVAIELAYKSATKEGRLIVRAALLYVLAMAILDITDGGRRMLITRYLTPATILIPICAASCIRNLLINRARAGAMLFLLIVCGGVISCVSIVNSSHAWNKFYPFDKRLLSSELNRKDNCLLICDTIYDTMNMSRLVKPNVLLEYAKLGEITIPESIDTVFLEGKADYVKRAVPDQGTWRSRRLGAELYRFTRTSDSTGDQLETTRNLR